jgi:hypothetical protein
VLARRSKKGRQKKRWKNNVKEAKELGGGFKKEIGMTE